MSKKKRVLCPETEDLSRLTPAQAKELLKDLMQKLDDLSLEDFFGTEGWRKYMGYRD